MPPYVARTEVKIDAPIEVVWRVMLDLAAYKDWNPFIVRVDNIPPRVCVGSVFTLHVHYSDGTSSSSQETVTNLAAPGSPDARGRKAGVFAYRFTGPLTALVQGTRFQYIEQEAGGRTLWRTEEEFSGLGAPLVPLAQVQDGFERHGAALKIRAESMLQRRR